jgi:OPA family glycerol-3-phosphate transporter-like MFS transporter
MGLTYAFLYMARYNLTVSKSALGALMSKEQFGWIFGFGALVYGISPLLINGPLTDRLGGKKAILIAASGAAFANLLMGAYLAYVLGLPDPKEAPLTIVFAGLYGLNMYFQSYGAVAIVKVNASWFHVRERGGFSGIFGIMISSGIFFAFDVSERILKLAPDHKWYVFWAPALLLVVMFAVETVLLRDKPSDAGLADFDTQDASSGEDDSQPVSSSALLRRILTNKVILTLALIEFCTGVLRQGVMQWFPIYAHEKTAALVALGQSGEGWEFAGAEHWGLLLMIMGIIGGNVGGWVSDKVFGSRRAPAAGGMYVLLVVAALLMPLFLDNSWALLSIALLMSMAVIGTHGLLSGTATMDFGGRKAAATAVGLIDGFVYLGTALQGFALGKLTTLSWSTWPWFLMPFGLIGSVLCVRIWNARPGAVADPPEVQPDAAPAPTSSA